MRERKFDTEAFLNFIIILFSLEQGARPVHSSRYLFPVITLACCASAVLPPAEAAAAESVKALEWEIHADKMTRYENPPSILAEGNVVLTKIEKTTGSKQEEEVQSGWSDLLGEDAGPAAEIKAAAIDAGTESESPASTEPNADPLATSKSVPVISENGGEDSVQQGETVTVSQVMSTIKADRMLYDTEKETVKMDGNVFIEIGPDQLVAEGGFVRLKEETGTFDNAAIIRQYKDMHLEGRVLEKTGDLTYHIEDGWIITCKLKDGEVPPWSFAASEADITDGGYAYLKHATFRIKDVPVFYTPFMILPAKRTRQTGLLFPLMSMSDKNGFGMELPLFINISPSSDITLYPHYIANRGFMAGAEGRYMLTEGDKGTLMANFLADDLDAEGRYTYTDQNRYWLRAKADQDFGQWTARLDLDMLSDSDYLSEFDFGRTGLSMSDRYFLDQFGRGLQDRTVDQRNNSLKVLRSWDNGLSLKGKIVGVDDLAAGDADSTALWKLPQIQHDGRLSLYDEIKTELSWETEYVNYWREAGVGAQRIDLYPKVTAAVPLLKQYLDSSASVGVRETMYSIDDNGDEAWQDSSSENRVLGSFESEISTLLRKDFGSAGSGWSHIFRPFVQYIYVTDDDQELPQFDSVDSFANQNLITYGLKNFFTVSGIKANKEEFERDYGYIKLQQGYDLRSEADDEPFQPVNLETAWYPKNNIMLKYSTDWDVYDSDFVSHVAEADYWSSRGDSLSFDYLYYKNDWGEDTNSLRFSTLVSLIYNVSAGYSLEKSLEDSVTVQEKFRLIYHPACWSVELGAETTPDNEQITILFQLANIGADFGMDLMGR
jgi:LPS-assembly protein